MTYKVRLSAHAKEQYDKLVKSGNKGSLKKFGTIVRDLLRDPFYGVGQPEQLKHHDGLVWSRRMDKKNRVVYEVDEENHLVLVSNILGHYRDK